MRARSKPEAVTQFFRDDDLAFLSNPMSHTNKYNTLYPLLYHDNPRAVSEVVLESGGDPIGRRSVVNF